MHPSLQGLADQGFEIISTGGTATAIQKMGVPVKKVEEVTGFPEMLDGEISFRYYIQAAGTVITLLHMSQIPCRPALLSRVLSVSMELGVVGFLDCKVFMAWHAQSAVIKNTNVAIMIQEMICKKQLKIYERSRNRMHVQTCKSTHNAFHHHLTGRMQ